MSFSHRRGAGYTGIISYSVCHNCRIFDFSSKLKRVHGVIQWTGPGVSICRWRTGWCISLVSVLLLYILFSCVMCYFPCVVYFI